MKCKEAEKSILLQDSGELEARKDRVLAAHLADCDSCQRFKQTVRESANVIVAEQEPSARMVQDVLRAARTNAPEKNHVQNFGLRPVLAMAASAVILLGLFLGVYNPNRVGMEFTVTDAQLMNSEDQVVSVMYDGLSEDDLAFNFLMTYEDEIEG